jgi:hypothetical protein
MPSAKKKFPKSTQRRHRQHFRDSETRREAVKKDQQPMSEFLGKVDPFIINVTLLLLLLTGATKIIAEAVMSLISFIARLFS